MKKSKLFPMSRRDILTKVMPSCVAACFVPGFISRPEGTGGMLFQEEKHKFDRGFTFGRPITRRQYASRLARERIGMGKTLIEELGEEKALDILKKNSWKRAFEVGQMGAKRNTNNSFQSYIGIFRQPGMLNTLTMEIVEDTEEAFEIKVTECLSCDVYKAGDFAGKFGYAIVCYGDFAWAEGYNPKIKLVRDKTLMEGHDCCNHRYIWTG